MYVLFAQVAYWGKYGAHFFLLHNMRIFGQNFLNIFLALVGMYVFIK